MEEGFLKPMLFLCMPPRTCILGAPEFSRMKHKCPQFRTVFNWSKKALLHALDTGIVGQVWFDALWQEPYTGPLTRYPQHF